MGPKVQSLQEFQSKSSKSINTKKSKKSQKMLTGSNVQSAQQQKSRIISTYEKIRNKQAIKHYIHHLFKMFSFVINFNYSVQNALITMIMISFLTPNIIDSLIWIIPNILSILIRPYLIRYVHKIHKTHRIRSQALIINLFLFLGAIGGFIIAQSTRMNDSKKGFHALRILVCSIGWTLTGISFELCDYFIDKFKTSLQQQFYIKKSYQQTDKKTDTNSTSNQQQKDFMLINFQEQQKTLSRFKFWGSLIGYLVVLILFTLNIKNKLRMKSFFQISNITYLITCVLTLFSAIITYTIISYVGIPRPDPSIKTKPVPFKISLSLNYYLPGWCELKSMSVRGLGYLGVHFIVSFVMDVMFIYTTMWIAVSQSTIQMKDSQGNFYGVQYGVGLLINFTIINNVNIPKMQQWRMTVFKLIILVSTIEFLLSFWFNSLLFYHNLITILAVFYSIYQNQIEPLLQEIEPQIKQAKQFIVRVQKIAVLNVLPFVTMIILGRDDIQDCMIWCAVLLFIALGLLVCFYNKQNQNIITQQIKSKSKSQ